MYIINNIRAFTGGKGGGNALATWTVADQQLRRLKWFSEWLEYIVRVIVSIQHCAKGN